MEWRVKLKPNDIRWTAKLSKMRSGAKAGQGIRNEAARWLRAARRFERASGGYRLPTHTAWLDRRPKVEPPGSPGRPASRPIRARASAYRGVAGLKVAASRGIGGRTLAALKAWQTRRRGGPSAHSKWTAARARLSSARSTWARENTRGTVARGSMPFISLRG